LKADRRSIVSILPFALGVSFIANAKAFMPERIVKIGSPVLRQLYLGMTLSEARLVGRHLDCDVLIETIEEISFESMGSVSSGLPEQPINRACTLKFAISDMVGNKNERPIIVRFESGLATKIDWSGVIT
jgi:hypothetical protein